MHSKFYNNEYVIICLYMYILGICLIFKLALMLCMKLKYFLHLSLILRHSKANVMLDIKFIRANDCIILSHAYYVEKML
jgi:hypothetical protein